MRCRRSAGRGQDERGQATIMIVGFAVVLAMAIVLVVDASAAYLQRQGLDTIADGAALQGADLGATGSDTYLDGVPGDQLSLTEATVRASVRAYLLRIGAYARYPGLDYDVAVDRGRQTVTVAVHAPLDLPLTVPGSPAHPRVGAQASAVVGVER